jgi:tyrosyl-tRNA synthetase
LLSEDTLLKNQEAVHIQLSRFLNFDNTLPNAAEMVNNYEWFKDMSFLTFIREVGKHITVNYMMAKDSVKKRIEGDSGISFTEFTYQLIQGYDYYWLYKYKNCKLQMGGSDQWGNITTGTEMIRRMSGGEAFAFTCPLLTKADGGKFGKTEQGNIWLDKNRTTAYQFFQFWYNAADTDAEKWIKIFTFLEKEIIDELIQLHNKDASKRILQRRLAEEITAFVHGQDGLLEALDTTTKLFSQEQKTIHEMSLRDIEEMQGVSRFEFSKEQIEAGMDIVSFLAASSIFPSKSEARKMVINGGISINRTKADLQLPIDAKLLLHNRFILVQKGKKNYYLVEMKS